MSTNWTRTAGEICKDALQHLGVQAAGQPVGAEDMQDALSALDSVLKELPLYGYSWPKLSTRSSLAWPALSLPTDYYGYLLMWANGRPLQRLKHTDYIALTDLTVTAETVTHFYVQPDNSIYLYPVPTTDPILTIQYQRLIDDTSTASAVDLPQYWNGALGFGTATELITKYDVPEQKAQRIERMWVQKKERALGNALAGEAISFSVADDHLDWGPQNWQAPTPIPDGWDAGQEP